MNQLKVFDCFSGIGGFSYGLELTGHYKTIAFCEIDDFCANVLKKHWEHIPIYFDICEVNGSQILLNHGEIDLMTGGFPCTNISHCGDRVGIDGKDSKLWYEFERLLGEIRPRYALIENSSALTGRGLSTILCGLARLGYDAEWHRISAAAIGAPQKRDRCFVIAYSRSQQMDSGTGGNAWLRQVKKIDWPRLVLPRRGRVDDGISYKLYKDKYGIDIPDWRNRVAACGNSVVPEIIFQIGKAIYEKDCS